MKHILVALLILPVLTLVAIAETPIPLTDVPEAVNKTILDYFPGSNSLSANKDEERGTTKFEVIVKYKDITLEVYVSPEGKLLEVDSLN